MAFSDAKKCGAKTKNGTPCLNPAMPNGKCRLHGGKTPSGLASPHTKTGIYSSSLPVRLGPEYETLLNLGSDLFRIDNETAVLTTLIQEQLARIETGESGAAWRNLGDLYAEMTILGKKPNKSDSDIQRFNSLFAEVGEVINSGSSTFAARSETVNLVEQKRKLVADERKDWAAKHQAMSFDRVMLIMTAMAACFKQSLEKHITNGRDRRSVLSDTQKFLNRVISE